MKKTVSGHRHQLRVDLGGMAPRRGRPRCIPRDHWFGPWPIHLRTDLVLDALDMALFVRLQGQTSSCTPIVSMCPPIYLVCRYPRGCDGPRWSASGAPRAS